LWFLFPVIKKQQATVIVLNQISVMEVKDIHFKIAVYKSSDELEKFEPEPSRDLEVLRFVSPAQMLFLSIGLVCLRRLTSYFLYLT